MVKSIFIYFLSFLLLGLFVYYTQFFLIDLLEIKIRFSILDLHLFFGVLSLIICTLLKILSLVKRLKEQVGFIYLFSLVLKLGLFALFFSKSILSIQNLTKVESLNILIILFVFTSLEVHFVVKLLNQKTLETNSEKK